MHQIVKSFERQAKFKDDNEAGLIREKLERLVSSILSQAEKRDERFKSTLIKSGSVYEGVKVHKPDEFDFMVRIDCLTNKLRLSRCENNPGYVRLDQRDEKWREFTDEQGFFSPNKLCRHFKRLVNESCSTIVVPKGMTIQELRHKEGAWGVVYTGLVGGEGRQSEVMDIESHGPATTIKVVWNGGSSYSGLSISVDLTLALEYAISNLPVGWLSDKLPQTVASGYLEKAGFHVVPAGFDMWRISFSTAEKHILSDTPDEFKACYRVLKYVRDKAAKELKLDASLVPSYIFKSVLLSQYFAAGAESKEKEYWLQQVKDTLDAVLQGIMHEDIQNFFLSGYNVLSTTDHKNKLRQFIVENMLSLVKGLKMTPHTREEVRETTRQIRVLEVVDALEFLLSEAFAGKDLTALWNKLFVNIDDVPTGASDDLGTKFYDQITDLDRLDLDEEVYVKLLREWDAFQYVFIQLIDYLPEEEKSLALKFFIRTWDKRKKFEREHHGDVANPVKITVHEAVCQYIMETVTDYIDERGYIGKFFSNLLKALPRDYTSPGFLSDVTAITWKEGSDRGSAVFKERLKKCMSGFSQSVLTSVIVGYVSQFFLHAKEGLRRKLDYIKIPELDVD